MMVLRNLLLLASVCLAGCGTSAETMPTTRIAKPQALAPDKNSVAGPKSSTQKVVAATSKPEQPRYTVLKPVSPAAETVPLVLLTVGHQRLCSLNVGDLFPALSLPSLGGPVTDLASLQGKKATVVLFWHPDRWMARTALIDMQRDVVRQFAANQVAVVGIPVRQPIGTVQTSLNEAKASFPQLLDTDGKAFAQVGTEALPRLYVLDPAGKIVWFDIEYSEGTRRELWQTLRVLTQ